MFNLLCDHFNWIADIGRMAGWICIPYIYNWQIKNSSEVGTAGASINKSLAEEGKIRKSFKAHIRNNYTQKYKSQAIWGDDHQALGIPGSLPYVMAEGSSPSLPPQGTDGRRGQRGGGRRHCGMDTFKRQPPRWGPLTQQVTRQMAFCRYLWRLLAWPPR